MKHAKRLVALALAAMLTVALLPTVAFAAGESAIQLGTGGLGTDDTVYFGTYNNETVPWYVLSSNTLSETTVASGAGVLPLLSQYLLGSAIFGSGGLATYSGSDLQAAMAAVYMGFATGEQGAIADTILTGGSIHSGKPDLTGQKLFPLSWNEAATGSGKYFADGSARIAYELANKSNAAAWWLRSTFFYNDSKANRAYYVDNLGEIYSVLAAGGTTAYLRPACNLDLTKVLFTSAAVGGKASGPVGAGALKQNLTPSGATGWKLTLLDSTRSGFSASLSSGSSATVSAGGSVSIDYSGAKTGANEYVSAMLVNSSGSVLYYGRIVNNAEAARRRKSPSPRVLRRGRIR